MAKLEIRLEGKVLHSSEVESAEVKLDGSSFTVNPVAAKGAAGVEKVEGV